MADELDESPRRVRRSLSRLVERLRATSVTLDTIQPELNQMLEPAPRDFARAFQYPGRDVDRNLFRRAGHGPAFHAAKLVSRSYPDEVTVIPNHWVAISGQQVEIRHGKFLH